MKLNAAHAREKTVKAAQMAEHIIIFTRTRTRA